MPRKRRRCSRRCAIFARGRKRSRARRKRAGSAFTPATASDPLADRRSPLAEALNLLGSRRVLLFGGKGGVGKTTVSVAVALHFSESRETILFTTDPASNLTDLFDNRHPTP